MVRSCSSLFTAIEQQEEGEADSTGTGNGTGTNRRRLTAATAAANGTSQAPTSTALYGGLRTSLGGLGHLMLKESLAGEGATTVLAERVQLSNSLVAPASLQGASFEAPRGNSSGSIAFPPDLGLGAAASVEVSFTTLQVNTHGQASMTLDGPTSSPGTEYLDVSLSDHTTLSTLAVRDTAQPLVLLIPVDAASLANPEPQPCSASEAAIGLCAVCDAADARLGRHNCSGHGAFTTPTPTPTPTPNHNPTPKHNPNPNPDPNQVRACTVAAGAMAALPRTLPPPRRARRCLSTVASVA